MNKKIKAKWLKALRSGKYKQGQSELRTDETHFCCLGVLGDIQGIKWGKEYAQGLAGHLAVLPRYYACGLSYGEQGDLSELNDGISGAGGGSSFSEIADYIEVNL